MKVALQKQETVQKSKTISKSSGNTMKDNRHSSAVQRTLIHSIQRAPEDDELVQGKFISQRAPEDEELMQGKFTVQRETKNNTGLPDNLKSGMENLSGMSLDHVKVHYNSPKPAAVQAHAYAQGSEIHLASGQEKHLPHELGHVVQQAQGRVSPTTSVGGMAVNDHPGLESEATKLGEQALRG